MKRLEYLTKDINELENTENELELNGISRSKIHVFSDSEAELEYRHLPSVPDFFKRNVIMSGLRGAGIGLVFSAFALIIPYLSGWHLIYSWLPFLLLSIVLLGFCTWEGGMIGLHQVNEKFVRYQPYVNSGSHLLMIDVDTVEENLVLQTLKHHPKLHRVNHAM